MYHHDHAIRICGHALNWHKPIKPYSLIKTALVLVLVSAPSFAAEKNPSSPATAHPDVSLNVEKSVTGQAAQRPQRTAGTPSLSPAMALAMALGLRTATGPMERAQKTVSPSTKDMKRLSASDRRDALARQKVSSVHALSKKENYPRVALE